MKNKFHEPIVYESIYCWFKDSKNLSYFCIICHFYDMYHQITNHALHKRIGTQSTNAFTE